FGQTAIPLRTSGELIETLQRHTRASQKYRTYRILSRELCHLRWKKVDAFDHVMVCERAHAPNKALQIREEPLRIRSDGLGSCVPLHFDTGSVLHSQEFHQKVC